MSFAATPIFLLMAFVTYFQGPALCTVTGDFGFLSSMWLMYAIMGAVHSGPWFAKAWAVAKSMRPRQQPASRSACPEAYEPSEHLAPAAEAPFRRERSF
ncbi:MAG: hypothetical protein WCD20_04145 [Rhodomicrobium sp.]